MTSKPRVNIAQSKAGADGVNSSFLKAVDQTCRLLPFPETSIGFRMVIPEAKCLHFSKYITYTHPYCGPPKYTYSFVKYEQDK